MKGMKSGKEEWVRVSKRKWRECCHRKEKREKNQIWEEKKKMTALHLDVKALTVCKVKAKWKCIELQSVVCASLYVLVGMM